MTSSKAQIGFEAAWVVIVLVVVALGFIFGLAPLSELNDDIQLEDDLSSEAKSAAETTVGNAPSNYDNLFFFLFIMLWIFLGILAFFSANNPVLLVITIIFMIVALVVAMFLANTYAESIEDTEINTFAQEFPKTDWMMNHLLMIILFMGFSVGLIIYARVRT